MWVRNKSISVTSFSVLTRIVAHRLCPQIATSDTTTPYHRASSGLGQSRGFGAFTTDVWSTPHCRRPSRHRERLRRANMRHRLSIWITSTGDWCRTPETGKPSSASGPHWEAAYSSIGSRTPFRACLPRSSKRRPEPATRSFTVRDTKISSADASAETREAMWTAMP
jgi:hypothetical protein